jgi:hypothetical protein
MPCWQVAITSHLDRAILTNAAWLRDSIGLWARFHALVQVGWSVNRGGFTHRSIASLQPVAQF